MYPPNYIKDLEKLNLINSNYYYFDYCNFTNFIFTFSPFMSSSVSPSPFSILSPNVSSAICVLFFSIISAIFSLSE